jgi:hypothetical protein
MGSQYGQDDGQNLRQQDEQAGPNNVPEGRRVIEEPSRQSCHGLFTRPYRT